VFQKEVLLTVAGRKRTKLWEKLPGPLPKRAPCQLLKFSTATTQAICGESIIGFAPTKLKLPKIIPKTKTTIPPKAKNGAAFNFSCERK